MRDWKAKRNTSYIKRIRIKEEGYIRILRLF